MSHPNWFPELRGWVISPVVTGGKIGFVRKKLDKAEISDILFRIFPGSRKCILSHRVSWGKKVTALLNGLNVLWV